MNLSRVFVTGGAGVIGQQLVPLLVSSGANVLVGDLKSRPSHFSESVFYRQGDLNDLTQEELDAFNPDAIIHLAATFERSTETPDFWDENFRHNVTLSHHLMTLARRSGTLRRVVFASSYLIYEPALYQFDRPQVTPRSLVETDPIRPRNLTGMAKLAHEQEIAFLTNACGKRFSSLCVRIFRGYGRGSRDVVSRWVRSLLAGHAIEVYRPEGMFDYICAGDSAEGLFRLLRCEAATGIVNLGTGVSRSVSDVVEVLRTHFPSAVVKNADSDIPFESSQACTRRLQSLLGWRPSLQLEDTIPDIIEFERSRSDREDLIVPRTSVRVLLTSASRKVPLVRALKSAIDRMNGCCGIVAADIDSLAVSRVVSNEFWQMPATDDAAVSSLIQQCVQRRIGVVLPSRDGELDFWARHRDAFAEAGIHVIVSSPEAIARCRDKLAFARFGAELNLPIIAASEDARTFAGVSLVVKERFGAGSRGIGLDLPIDDALAHARKLQQPIFQPFVQGPEITVDGWIDRAGVVVGVVLRRRDRVVSGESQVTTTFSDHVLEAQAVEVLTALDLRGPVVLQAIVVDGGLRVIECNPRFGGASTASIAVGLDSLYWSLCEATGESVTPVFRRSAGQVRQVRMPSDLIIHGSDF